MAVFCLGLLGVCLRLSSSGDLPLSLSHLLARPVPLLSVAFCAMAYLCYLAGGPGQGSVSVGRFLISPSVASCKCPGFPAGPRLAPGGSSARYAFPILEQSLGVRVVWRSYTGFSFDQ